MLCSYSLKLFFFLFLHLFLANAEPIPSLPNLRKLSFHEGYTQIFGDNNLMLHHEGKKVHISLDERTGSGFRSQESYLHGFFSASIKLPSDYTAGVVVAFYFPIGKERIKHGISHLLSSEFVDIVVQIILNICKMSNGDVYEKTHDELDFEFLGNVRGKDWRIQTNVYGNGSTSVGREERYGLWFDPTKDFHQYSILWTYNNIIFYVDDIAIREVERVPSSGGYFPSKPMSLYATIWDGSQWATSGGRYKVNYKYAPYIAEFTDLVLHTCPNHQALPCGSVSLLSPEQRLSMESFRRRYMTYGYCYDRIRYPVPLAECHVGPERELYLMSGESRAYERRRHMKRRAWRATADPGF